MKDMSDQPNPQETKPKTNKMTIAGFILAFLFPLAGFIVSMNGLYIVNRTNEPGRRLAIAGMIISAVLIVASLALAPYIFRTAEQMHMESRDRTRQTNVDLLHEELQEYHQTNNYYPPSIDAIEDDLPRFLFEHEEIQFDYDYQPAPEGCEECEEYILGIDLEANGRYQVSSEE